MTRFDRSIMSSYLNNLITRQVPTSSSFVTGCNENFCSILQNHSITNIIEKTYYLNNTRQKKVYLHRTRPHPELEPEYFALILDLFFRSVRLPNI